MRHDVAIYAPSAAGVYSREYRRTGGAERQTDLLARSLSAAGLRVAHIIYRIDDPLPVPNENLSLVMRPLPSPLGSIGEIRHVWRSLVDADAAVYVFRTGSPVLGIVAAFCRAYGRRLIFAGSTDADFTLRTLNDGPTQAHRTLLYRAGLRAADAVVVQTSDQLDVARNSFERLAHVTHVPSFAELLEPAKRPGRQFVWIGRTTDYKRPHLIADLAEALPEAHFRAVAVHDTSHNAELYIELERRCAKLPNFDVSGPIPHAEVTSLIGDAVAVVNTSVTEGMPNVFLEGWARGVPALTLDCDPDGLIASRAVGIAASGSWERFVEGARQLWEGRAAASEMSRASRDYITEVHSIPAVSSRWIELVRELARRTTGARRVRARVG
jgi:glycosyltransferase involved in cell wall biosynthesis